MLVALALGCAPSYSARDPVHPTLTLATSTQLGVADALEALIAVHTDTPADRRYAYERVKAAPVVTAADALGRAIIAGRLAQVSGLAAPGLVAEVERYARRSAELDATLRFGAANRLLGTLYVQAPAALLSHGDSEAGLQLLKEVVRRFPEHVINQLRLAEAYVALGDPDPARPYLCYCVAHRADLRIDEQKQLDDLVAQAQGSRCP